MGVVGRCDGDVAVGVFCTVSVTFLVGSSAKEVRFFSPSGCFALPVVDFGELGERGLPTGDALEDNDRCRPLSKPFTVSSGDLGGVDPGTDSFAWLSGVVGDRGDFGDLLSRSTVELGEPKDDSVTRKVPSPGLCGLSEGFSASTVASSLPLGSVPAGVTERDLSGVFAGDSFSVRGDGSAGVLERDLSGLLDGVRDFCSALRGGSSPAGVLERDLSGVLIGVRDSALSDDGCSASSAGVLDLSGVLDGVFDSRSAL